MQARLLVHGHGHGQPKLACGVHLDLHLLDNNSALLVFCFYGRRCICICICTAHGSGTEHGGTWTPRKCYLCLWMLALLARASRDETRLDSGKVSRQADYYCVFHLHFLSQLGWPGWDWHQTFRSTKDFFMMISWPQRSTNLIMKTII